MAKFSLIFEDRLDGTHLEVDHDFPWEDYTTGTPAELMAMYFIRLAQKKKAKGGPINSQLILPQGMVRGGH